VGGPQKRLESSLTTASNLNSGSVGLCSDCQHARIIRSDRGSIFYLCGLSATDARFPKYPRLPVLNCAGYTKREPVDS
jgi:hypothetical protein